MKRFKITLILLFLVLCMIVPVYAKTTSINTENMYTPGERFSTMNTARIAGQWIQASDGRWWYRHDDGSFTTNDWEFIDGEWYHFDSQGWMQTGTLVIEGITFKLNSSGALYYTGLAVVRRRQDDPNWCWAASAQMVGRYFNPRSTISQSDMVTFVKGSPVSEGGMDYELEEAIEFICDRDAYADNT